MYAALQASLNIGMKNFFCGPESFTPDLQPIVGEAPELKNYFVAAGMNSIGTTPVWHWHASHTLAYSRRHILAAILFVCTGHSMFFWPP